MSIEYLSVIISKIPTLLNLLSLQDICNIRQLCNNMKNEVDKKLIITRCNKSSLERSNYHNDSLQVTCQDHYYKKITITDSREGGRYANNPFIDDTYEWVMDHCISVVSIISIITEDNDNRMIKIRNGTMDVDDTEEWCITEDITQISDNHYYGTSSRPILSDTGDYRTIKSIPLHYLKFKDEVIMIVEDGLYLEIVSTNRPIGYYINRDSINIIDSDDPLHVAINIVLKMQR